MSTRGLLAIQCDGKYRLAQYLASDAYLEGAGMQILAFIAKITETGQMDRFRQHANRLHYDPSLSEYERDYYPDVLDSILDGSVRAVYDDLSFAQDSLFCEWAYVLDLDRMVLECYKGFNEEPLKPGDRFYVAGTEGKHAAFSGKTFYAVRKVGEIAFSDIVMTSFDDILDEWKGNARGRADDNV